MTHTDHLNALQGQAHSEHPASGKPTRIWPADVVTVNPDGSVDCQPLYGRGTKVAVPVPSNYNPSVGDRVLVCDLNGDPRVPLVLGLFNRTRPTVTGAKSNTAGSIPALASLMTELAELGLVTDQTS